MNIKEYILWLLYPKRCSVCNKIIDRHSLICDNCNEKIEWVDKFCIKCGSVKEECRCRYNVFRFNACVAPFKNGKYSMRAVCNFKFRDNGDSAEFLSRNITKSVKKYMNGIRFDAVTAVPQSKLKRFKKGYNQSEIMAKYIAADLEIKYQNLLYKAKNNEVQHALTRRERFDNVKGVYKAYDTGNLKTVLLVDDIITTGATLNECTRALMMSGVENVYCAVAITNSGNKKTGEKNEN